MLRNAPQAEVDDVATTATRAMDDGTGGAEEHRVMEDGEVGDLSTWEDTYKYLLYDIINGYIIISL